MNILISFIQSLNTPFRRHTQWACAMGACLEPTEFDDDAISNFGCDESESNIDFLYSTFKIFLLITLPSKRAIEMRKFESKFFPLSRCQENFFFNIKKRIAFCSLGTALRQTRLFSGL